MEMKLFQFFELAGMILAEIRFLLHRKMTIDSVRALISCQNEAKS